jgi:hypothetical protein
MPNNSYGSGGFTYGTRNLSFVGWVFHSTSCCAQIFRMAGCTLLCVCLLPLPLPFILHPAQEIHICGDLAERAGGPRAHVHRCAAQCRRPLSRKFRRTTKRNPRIPPVHHSRVCARPGGDDCLLPCRGIPGNPLHQVVMYDKCVLYVNYVVQL